MLRCQPVSKTNTDPPHSLHAADTGRQFGTQEPRVGRLVRDAPDGGQPKIDRSRCVSALFEVNPIPEHDGAVEREAGLRTVPGNELADRVVVGALPAGGCQGIQHRRLAVFEVWEGQTPLRRLLLARFRLRHRRRPPSPSPTASADVCPAAFVAGNTQCQRRRVAQSTSCSCLDLPLVSTLPSVLSSVVGVANDFVIQTAIPHAALRWARSWTRVAPEAVMRRAPWQEISLRPSAAFGDHQGRCRRAARVRASPKPTRTEPQ